MRNKAVYTLLFDGLTRNFFYAPKTDVTLMTYHWFGQVTPSLSKVTELLIRPRMNRLKRIKLKLKYLKAEKYVNN